MSTQEIIRLIRFSERKKKWMFGLTQPLRIPKSVLDYCYETMVLTSRAIQENLLTDIAFPEVPHACYNAAGWVYPL